MRTTTADRSRAHGGVWAAAVGTLLFCGSLLPGQQPPRPVEPELPGQPKSEQPAAGRLEDLLAKALKDNPDIRVAEAKVREAEAELNRTRLQVMQKVVSLYHALESHKVVLAAAEADLRTAGDPVAGNQARHRLLQAKAKLAEIEAEMPYLTGQQPRGLAESRAQSAVRSWDVEQTALVQELVRLIGQQAGPAPEVHGTMAEKIRKALDAPAALNFDDAALPDVLEYVKELSGVPLVNLMPDASMKQVKVNLRLERVSLGAALQALEDVSPARFAVRDYGILVLPKDRSFPGGTVPLHTFWKAGAVADRLRGEATTGETAKNPPPDSVEGVIKATDPQSGYVTVSVGSDAGLRKGHTLEVYRLKPESKYLGTIRILEVKPTEAVGKPVSRTLGPIQVGDRVAARLKAN
jgi:hypothetical protein